MIFSIITPSFNSSEFISTTIVSIIQQTLTSWELLIIDDYSTDNTVSIVERFISTDDRIKLLRLNENSGAAVARNVGIEQAKGRYIAFLDSDDIWSPTKLEKQLNFMEKNQYPFTYTEYKKIDVQGKVIGDLSMPSRISYHDMLKGHTIGCLTAVYDTNYFGKVYMPIINKRQDLGLWLKLLKKGRIAYGVNESLAFYRVRSDSISSNKLSAATYTWRLYRDIENINFFKALYYFWHYAYKGILKTKLPLLKKVFYPFR